MVYILKRVKLEDTKGVIQSCKQNKTDNTKQQKKGKKTTDDLQNTTLKTKE